MKTESVFEGDMKINFLLEKTKSNVLIDLRIWRFDDLEIQERGFVRIG